MTKAQIGKAHVLKRLGVVSEGGGKMPLGRHSPWYMPLDPYEKDLDKLIKRAERFQ